MILKFKQIALLSLVATMVISIFSIKNVNAAELYSVDENVITINDTNSGYQGSIETVYNDETIHKYRISEFGETYSLLIDTTKDKVFVNNHELSLQEFTELSNQQLVQLQTKSRMNSNISIVEMANVFPENQTSMLAYEQLHKDYTVNLENHFHNQNGNININTRCMFCPLKTTTVPTSNYKSKEYNIGSKSNKMQIAMTSTLIAAFAAYVTWGISAMASAVISGFLELLGVSIAFAQVDYHAYQSLHNVCYSAVKERRKIWIQDTETGKFKEQNKYHYFYSSKPF